MFRAIICTSKLVAHYIFNKPSSETCFDLIQHHFTVQPFDQPSATVFPPDFNSAVSKESHFAWVMFTG